PLAVATIAGAELQVVDRFGGLTSPRLFDEVLVIPGRELRRPPPPALTPRGLVLVLHDEPVAGKLAKVVARGAARLPEALAELGGCGGSGLAKGAEEASPKRVRDRPQCLDLGDSGAICVVHAAIITAKMSLHKYLCKR